MIRCLVIPALAALIAGAAWAEGPRPVAQGEAEETVDPVCTGDCALPATAASAPEGGLTPEEISAFRTRIAACWSLPEDGADWPVVTVAFSMDEAAQVIPGSIALIDSDSDDAARSQAAFDAARVAILRCQTGAGAAGYDLPAAAYELWRDVELRFDPRSLTGSVGE